jgi:hypothetical protein
MIGDFGCCTNPYDKSQGLIEVIKDEFSLYRGILQRPLRMLRQEAIYLIGVEIRNHVPTVVPDLMSSMKTISLNRVESPQQRAPERMVAEQRDQRAHPPQHHGPFPY